ncbi:MAG: orotate phosphoribosyltransferase [Blautia sp.]|nr:orotate phosphoribosyltransferase [Blautia sp.]
MEKYVKLTSQRYHDVVLRVIPGHFVTPNSHVNYYMDMAALKSRTSEARAAARALSEFYYSSTYVDTIICLDGTEVIGAYLAEELSHVGVISANRHKSIYVISPEYNNSGQMIFRENIQQWINDKNVLLLLASATTGKTMAQSVESLIYYGAKITGISAIFSVTTKLMGMPVHYLFSPTDLPDYATYSHDDCALCKKKIRVDAMCNGFGITPIR